MTAVLMGMTPAQKEGWNVLLDFTHDLSIEWCLLGGQMVWLLASEHGVDPPRATEDMDVVVDLRADAAGIKRLCRWLERHNFELGGINSEGIGHRYGRKADPGPGNVLFDILAPDNLGPHADLTTSPPARTLCAPGARDALNHAELVEVTIGDRSGTVRRPSLLAAIVAKAAATKIPIRTNPDRDWADAAFLLTLIDDPLAAADHMTAGQKKRLQAVSKLLQEEHPAWAPLGTRAREGQTALEFLLGTGPPKRK